MNIIMYGIIPCHNMNSCDAISYTLPRALTLYLYLTSFLVMLFFRPQPMKYCIHSFLLMVSLSNSEAMGPNPVETLKIFPAKICNSLTAAAH